MTRRLLTAAVAAFVFLATSLAVADSPARRHVRGYIGTGPGGAATGDIELNGHNIDMEDGDILNVDDIYPDAAMASDAAPTPITVIATKHPYPGIAAANNDGADICIIPASGSNDLTGVTFAATTGDTLTFTTLDYDCEEEVTFLTEGVDYDCDGAGTDDACVINIVAAVNGLAAALGLNAVAANGETTNFYPTVGTVAHLVVVSSDNANTAISRGTDGILDVHSGLNVAEDADVGGVLTVTGDLVAAGGMHVGAHGFFDAGLVIEDGGALLLGSSYAYFYRWDVNGTEIEFGSGMDNIFTIPGGTTIMVIDESVSVGRPPITDIDPPNRGILGANAAPIATGARQNGATMYITGGIGSRTVTIDDYTNCATKTVSVTINGGAPDVCTENDTPSSVQWDAVTDNDTSATNLAMCLDAITGISAEAVAAVAYITPDADLWTVGLAESEVTCTTLVEGEQGPVQVASAVVGFGAVTDQYPAWYSDGSAGVTLAGGAAVTDVMDLTVTGEVSMSGVTGDGVGKAVCIKADGDLGTCTDAVGAGGTCTCT